MNIITLITWLSAHNYLLYFFASLTIGSPVVVAAGVITAWGFYQLIWVIVLGIMADVLGDLGYYTLGYFGRGLFKPKVFFWERILHQHLGKTLALAKISPLIPIPTMIAIGSARVPLKKYLLVSLLVSIPKTTFFALLGYFSAAAYINLDDTLKHSNYALGIIVLVVLGIYLLYRYLIIRLSKLKIPYR